MPLPSPDFWYGVAVTAVAAFLTYWFGVRRRRLTLTYDVTTLIPTGGEKLAVTWDGVEVPNPFLVQVKLEASNAGDITPANYIGGGVTLDVGAAKAVGVLATEDSPPCSVRNNELVIEPFLLKHGKSASATFLASGKHAWVSSEKTKLADASVAVRAREEMRPRMALYLGGAYVVIGLAYMAGGAWLRKLFPPSTMDATLANDPVILGGTMVGLGLLIMGVFRWRIHQLRSKRKDEHSEEGSGSVTSGATTGAPSVIAPTTPDATTSTQT